MRVSVGPRSGASRNARPTRLPRLTRSVAFRLAIVALAVVGGMALSSGQALARDSAPPPPTGDPLPASGVNVGPLVFRDEFDGTALDRNKWEPCWFYLSGCANQHKVATSPNNVAVTGGNLVLTLASSSSGASVTTNPRFGAAGAGFRYRTGIVEARIWFPGDGVHCYNWPAWWTTGQSWPTNGEHDIAEVLRGNMTVNYHSSSGSHNQGAVPGYWCGGFHTYAVHRKVGSADVYYDGVRVKSYPTDDGNAPHYLVINVGVSNKRYPAYGAASQIRVDYVRAWG